jgi:hypothetical protein
MSLPRPSPLVPHPSPLIPRPSPLVPPSIYVGIDDTDVLDSPGTNKLARHLIRSLADDYESVLAVRHQLLFDPRIPYTSKNSSASLLFKARGKGSVEDLAAKIRALMLDWYVEGSDPGLCLSSAVPDEITRFGRRCQAEIVAQEDARGLAAQHGIYLEGLGGTEGGVIGALAAVGLLSGGNDGRVVSVGHWPDDLSGPAEIEVLHSRGVEVRHAQTQEPVRTGSVDVGKHLRPNYRGGRIVLFVAPAPPDPPPAAAWHAVRLT